MYQKCNRENTIINSKELVYKKAKKNFHLKKCEFEETDKIKLPEGFFF